MRLHHALLGLLLGCADSPPEARPEPGEPCSDTDGDDVCDEDDLCPDFDDRVDGDGDGAPDGCDPCPLDAADDSDGDGLCDADDPCPLDDPDDSDGDGVCDTNDLCPDFDDGIDEDGDGTPDACDACPLDELDDRDGDGACDSDDPCPDDDPDDSDGDGECDRWDVCPGVDDAVDDDADGMPDGCACTGIDVPTPAGVAVGGVFDGIGVALDGIVGAGGVFEDYGFVGQPYSARVRLVFLLGSAHVCSIWWDLSEPGAAMPSNAPWTTTAPVTMFEAWDLSLSGGQDDCGLTPDAIAQLEGLTLGIGIGPMHALDVDLKGDPAVAAAWAADWEPWIASLYVSVHGGDAVEASYVRAYDRTCENVRHDMHSLERIPLQKPTTAPLLEFYEATAVRNAF